MSRKSDFNSIYKTYRNSIVQENLSLSDSLAETPPPSNMPVRPPVVSVATPVDIDNEANCNDADNQRDNLDMAKSEIFKIYTYANELMNIVSTCSKIQPWMLSKISIAGDYLCSVKSAIQFDEFERCQQELESGMNDIANNIGTIDKIKDMLSDKDITFNEEVLRQVIFNIECLKENSN
jgi:archaellum component FlaC